MRIVLPTLLATMFLPCQGKGYLTRITNDNPKEYQVFMAIPSLKKGKVQYTTTSLTDESVNKQIPIYMSVGSGAIQVWVCKKNAQKCDFENSLASMTLEEFPWKDRVPSIRFNVSHNAYNMLLNESDDLREGDFARVPQQDKTGKPVDVHVWLDCHIAGPGERAIRIHAKQVDAQGKIPEDGDFDW